jgi:PAS domain-containing protein
VKFLAAIGDRAAAGLVKTRLIAELKSTRHRFERILDVLGEAVTVRDAGGRLVYANEAAARLFGVATPGELLAAAPTHDELARLGRVTKTSVLDEGERLTVAIIERPIAQFGSAGLPDGT